MGKYEEALERAKMFKGRYPTPGKSDLIDAIFPELAENEDERIRKHIIKILDSLAPCHWDGNEKAKCIAYLEKQKEQKPNQSEEEREYVKTLKGLVSDFIRDSGGISDVAYYQKICDWLDERHIEQNSSEQNSASGNSENPNNHAEWSEEDEKFLLHTIALLEDNVGKNCSSISWLKSLRPQPQRRDTYYDIIHSILNMLKDKDFTQITPEHRVSLLNDIRVRCKHADEWAEILDEPHWKPTEEQIQLLQGYVSVASNLGDGAKLKKLIGDLKKL